MKSKSRFNRFEPHPYNTHHIFGISAGTAIAVAGAAGSLAGGAMQGSAAGEAGAQLALGQKEAEALYGGAQSKNDKLLKATGKSGDKLLKRAERWGQKQYKPYSRLGTRGTNALARYLGLQKGGDDFDGYNKRYTQADLMADPVYQTELNENVRAWDNSAASRGSLMSGNTVAGLRELTAAGIQRGYDRDWNQRDRKFNALTGVSNMGLGVANTRVGLRTGTAQGRAGLRTGAAQGRVQNNQWSTTGQANARVGQASALASGTMNQGTAMGNAFNNIGQMGMYYGSGAFGGNTSGNASNPAVREFRASGGRPWY